VHERGREGCCSPDEIERITGLVDAVIVALNESHGPAVEDVDCRDDCEAISQRVTMLTWQ